MNVQELIGKTRSHIQQYNDPSFAAHPAAATAFFAMAAAAANEGFRLHPFSAFRDFTTQLKIWNQKYYGNRPLYSPEGKELDYATLSEEERLTAMLRWSALPGASRHHWGTDIDVIDAKALTNGYQVKLLPEETDPGGVFYELHGWLDENMAQFGFFRPYRTDRGWGQS